ncbi:MAG: nucleotidyltransferase domain-containing protein [Steroidobacteraceae bacterium]
MNASRSALFSTVPSHDYLQFWQAGRFQPQRVARFLNLSKEEVSRLSGIAMSSVRFDRKAPRDLIERLVEVAATCTLVAQFFEGNTVKAALWFKATNPLLGDISPRDMIRSGRHDKLRHFVVNAVTEPAPERFLGAHRERVVGLCQRHGVRRLALFWSPLRPHFDPEASDVDLAVEFAPASDGSAVPRYFEFKIALEDLFGRPVELVELSSMPDSPLRRIIERTLVPLYRERG